MNLTNYKSKTSVLGFSIPNLIIYSIVAGFIFLIYKTFTSLIDRVKKFLGLSSDTDDSIADNNEQLTKIISKNTAVQTQVTNDSRLKAEKIWEALNKYGYDQKAVYSVFIAISGPNQMAAIFKIFGNREISLFPFGSKKGNMIEIIKWRMTSDEYNKNLGTDTVRWSIRTKLNWIGTIK